MKKIYSFLMLLVMTAFSVAATAKTFTITVDDQNHIGYAMLTSNYNYLTFAGNKVEFEAEATDYLIISPASGYKLASIKDGGGKSLVHDLSGNYVEVELAALGDGNEIKVTTVEKEPKIFTFTGDERLTVSMYTDETGNVVYHAENGVFTVQMPDNGWYPVAISSDIETLAVRRVVADNGGEHFPDRGTVSIYPYSYEESTHFTIETYNPDEVRTASMTVKVNGSADNVILSRSDYTTVKLNSDGETIVKFDPENETNFTISSYNPLYQVKQNDKLLTASYDTYNITVSDGDVIEIDPDFPDVDVPVTFTFTNEGTEDAVEYVRVDYQNVDWKQDNFTIKLGSNLYVKLNNNDYDITEWKVNNETQSSYSTSYSETVTSEEGLEFVITATKKTPKNITVHCDEYEHVVVYALNQYFSQFESYELTGKDSQIEVSAAASYVQIKAVGDWIISYIEDANGMEYTSNSYIPASEGLELYAGAKALERDRNLTVYIGGEEDNWQYYGITLSSDDYDIRKEYTSYEGNLSLGYTNIPFGEFDCPIEVSGYTYPEYTYPIIYLNDNLIEFNQSTWRYDFDGMVQDGDVLKLFPADPAKYNVTYQIAEGVEVEVIQDHSRTIDAATTHEVLEGTEVWIKAANEIAVTVNGANITANEEGIYVFSVNEDAIVKVESNVALGAEITVNFNIYDKDLSNDDEDVPVEGAISNVKFLDKDIEVTGNTATIYLGENYTAQNLTALIAKEGYYVDPQTVIATYSAGMMQANTKATITEDGELSVEIPILDSGKTVTVYVGLTKNNPNEAPAYTASVTFAGEDIEDAYQYVTYATAEDGEYAAAQSVTELFTFAPEEALEVWFKPVEGYVIKSITTSSSEEECIILNEAAGETANENTIYTGFIKESNGVYTLSLDGNGVNNGIQISVNLQKKDVSTSIDSIETSETEKIIYNLNGIRVNNNGKLAKGVYIVNGKKVVVK